MIDIPTEQEILAMTDKIRENPQDLNSGLSKQKLS